MTVGAGATGQVSQQHSTTTAEPDRFAWIEPLLPGLGLVLVLGLVAQGLAAVQQATLGRIWLEALVIERESQPIAEIAESCE